MSHVSRIPTGLAIILIVAWQEQSVSALQRVVRSAPSGGNNALFFGSSGGAGIHPGGSHAGSGTGSEATAARSPSDTRGHADPDCKEEIVRSVALPCVGPWCWCWIPCMCVYVCVRTRVLKSYKVRVLVHDKSEDPRSLRSVCLTTWRAGVCRADPPPPFLNTPSQFRAVIPWWIEEPLRTYFSSLVD